MITISPWMLRPLLRIGLLTLTLAIPANASLAGPVGPASSSGSRPHVLRYLSPAPGAKWVRPQTGIIVRLDRVHAIPDAIWSQALTVTGSATGVHHGTTRWAADGRTLLFDPDRDFGWGERVTVRIAPALLRSAGVSERAFEFDFDVTATPPPNVSSSLRMEYGGEPAAFGREAGADGARPATVLDSLPPDFPVVTIEKYGAAALGRLFLAPLSFNGSTTPYLLVLDDTGTPWYWQRMSASCLDFKLQPNGQTTYFDQSTDKFYAMDDAYAIVDSFVCGNGYPTDVHELLVMPDGHSFLMSYDPQQVDMSQVVEGGDSAAIVLGLVIQELDENKDVVFEWRSWDHYQITDATHQDLTGPMVDYAHGNAIELDGDGDLMISCRHMDEITKIDRDTGDMVWRWGGENNQFTFVDDTLGFSHQHAIRRLANGNVLLFDNGNFHDPPFSRAVEYALDETTMTATLVWQYRDTPDIYGLAMGYAQRLDNGNTLISWGTGKPDITEVTPAGEKVLQLTLPQFVATYRAFRFVRPQDVSVPPGLESPRLALSGAFPNPARARAQFRLTLTEPSEVSLEIFDLAGRLVHQPLVRARLQAGEHQLEADVSEQAPGLYFCRFSAGDASETRKVVVGR